MHRIKRAFYMAFSEATWYDCTYFSQTASRFELGCYLFVGAAVLYFAARGLM